MLVTVGMADTVMVSTVGEAAVSGISLVDQVNVLLIQDVYKRQPHMLCYGSRFDFMAL